jgi:hypothetical protein
MKEWNVENKKLNTKTGMEKGSGTGTGTQYRVVINKESNLELEKLVAKIKVDSETVEVTKSDIANYIFCNLNKVLSEADIKQLKNIYFDERKVLQNLLKQSQDGAELPLEIKKMVRDFYGLTDREKKRNPKNNTEAVLDG